MFDRERLVGGVKEYGGRGLHAGWSTLGDFQKFILRGNVVDLAVGVVIGAAFNTVVQGFINDIIQPLIGKLGGGAKSFNSFSPGGFLIGSFIGTVISFLLTAAVVYFFVVKPTNILDDRYNRLRPKHDEAPTTRDCPYCLSSVPLQATRCAYCTSPLPPANVPPAAHMPPGQAAPQQ